jgi:hypothetical protein
MLDISSNENQNLFEELEKHKIEDDSSITGGAAPTSGPPANSVAVNIENNYIGDDGIVFDGNASLNGGFSPAFGGLLLPDVIMSNPKNCNPGNTQCGCPTTHPYQNKCN